MTTKVRMTLVADAAVTDGRFHVMMVVEETWTGDGRMFTAGSLSWRDLPFPLMAIDRTTWEHQDAILVGNFDTIERVGDEVHGWGAWVTAEEGSEAARLIGLIQRDELRGVSVDIDDIEFELLLPVEPEATDDETVEEATDADDDPVSEFPRETVDDEDYIVIEERAPRLRVTEGRIMGATVVPFPAFQEAFIEPEGATSEPADDSEPPVMAASAARVMAAAGVTGIVVETGDDLDALTAAGGKHFQFPDIPPPEWFSVPEPDGPFPLTFTDDGQVYGHVAVWGECHVGFSEECVEPPSSPSNYARFHTGEVPCDDGSRVSVGHLTFGTGHADRTLNAEATAAHYDNTGTVAADIVAVDGEYGIWVCGAARSTLSDAQVREVMAAPPSGDWRRFGRNLDMVGVLSVNVPGFNDAPSSRAALVRREEGLVASLIVSAPPPARSVPVAGSVTLDAVTAGAVRAMLSGKVNAVKRRRLAALDDRVAKVRA